MIATFNITGDKNVILIAFDTIFEQCSVAILADGKVIYTDTVAGSRGQTEIILPMLDKALLRTGLSIGDIGAWAFNRGPGAFSGIRINTAVVQALSLANDAPCVGVSSLLVLAYMAFCEQSFADGTTITALIDARQNQLYAGKFIIKNGQVIADDHEYLADYHDVITADVVVGDGVDLVMTDAKKFVINPDASHIAHLAYPMFIKGEAVRAEHALPIYLRNHAWKTLAEQQKLPKIK